MVFFFKLFLIVVGLTVPGYMIARIFRVDQPWAVTFPLSALFMVETLIFFSIAGIPIRFATMTGSLLVCVICCHLTCRALSPLHQESGNYPEDRELPPWLTTTILIIAIVVLATVALRTTLFPLRGLDTSFRWEGLALGMLQQQSLDFYPPVSADDYAIYLYPDGIPPLVATIYWWIYAVLGAPVAPTTSISITLQLATMMALIFYGAHCAIGLRAAWFALLAAVSTPLLILGIAIGQETGFTAISVAGQLCFAWAAVRKPRVSTVIVAAMFAALGAMARDYGPALALAGLSVIAWHRETRRYLPAFILTVVLLSAPWYLRNWALTGNPFFSHRLPGGFTVNPVHAAIMDYYKETYSFLQFDRLRWLALLKHFLSGGFLVIFIGLPFLLTRWKNLAPLLITTLLVILLWIYSVGQTAGGVIFSTRVLTPVAAILAIATGVAFSHFHTSRTMQKRPLQIAAGAGLSLLVGYTLISAAIYPAPSSLFFSVPTSTSAGSVQEKVINRLEDTDLPTTGVLMDLPFAGETMKRGSRFRPVMYWSPEADFVFDRNLKIETIHQRLHENNIRLVMVDQYSPNNPFLINSSFFRERSTWEALAVIPKEAGIFYFGPP